MVSLGNVSSRSVEPMSSPSRISSSTDIFTDKKKTKTNSDKTSKSHGKDKKKLRNVEFEFLSANFSTNTMLTADELFFEGKLRSFSQVEQLEELNKITLKPKEKYAEEEEPKESQKEGIRASWFMDEDPSPRPPTCTVLWKELLNLKKQRASPPLPPSTSSSPSSSSSMVRMESIDEGKEGKEGKWSKEKHVKRIKKGLERTRSGSFRIRPMVNVPICTQSKSTTAMPPMFSLKKVNVDR